MKEILVKQTTNEPNESRREKDEQETHRGNVNDIFQVFTSYLKRSRRTTVFDKTSSVLNIKHF